MIYDVEAIICVLNKHCVIIKSTPVENRDYLWFKKWFVSGKFAKLNNRGK